MNEARVFRLTLFRAQWCQLIRAWERALGQAPSIQTYCSLFCCAYIDFSLLITLQPYWRESKYTAAYFFLNKVTEHLGRWSLCNLSHWPAGVKHKIKLPSPPPPAPSCTLYNNQLKATPLFAIKEIEKKKKKGSGLMAVSSL